jgi:hypothetical protein
VKFLQYVVVPPSDVTDTIPSVAPGITSPTTAVPELETTTAGVPPMINEVGLLKLVPLIVTNVPTGPHSCEIEVIVGWAKITVNPEKNKHTIIAHALKMKVNCLFMTSFIYSVYSFYTVIFPVFEFR